MFQVQSCTFVLLARDTHSRVITRGKSADDRTLSDVRRFGERRRHVTGAPSKSLSNKIRDDEVLMLLRTKDISQKRKKKENVPQLISNEQH